MVGLEPAKIGSILVKSYTNQYIIIIIIFFFDNTVINYRDYLSDNNRRENFYPPSSRSIKIFINLKESDLLHCIELYILFARRQNSG